MNDEYYETTSDESVRPEALKLTARIKEDLFGLRNQLKPIIMEGRLEEAVDKPMPGTALSRELSQIVDLIAALKRDIKL